MSGLLVCSCLSCRTHRSGTGGRLNCGFYPLSSMTDAQWAAIERLLPAGSTGGRGGRPEKHLPLRVTGLVVR